MTNHYISTKTNRVYLFLLLCFISISQSSCLTQIYSPSSTLSMTGTTGYCQGAAATPNTLTYNQCTSGTGIIPTGVNYTAQWYVNTTGGTSIPASTAYGAPISGTSPGGGSGSISYTPSTATTGTFYYFCNVTWPATGTTCAPSFTSSAQMITISTPPAPLTGTGIVCTGQTTTLSTTSTGGTWSSSNAARATVSASGVVTGVSAGTVVISYASGPGCAATMIVTVDAGPGPITPAGTLVMCEGTTSSLGNSVAGGTWSSSNPTVASVSTSGLVTAVTGGTATISYTVASGCYVTKAVTVNPVPTGITGSSFVCLGTNITLTPSSPGGVWSSSNPAAATVNTTTGVVTGVAVGTTTITYSGCGYVVKDITVNPLPAPITGTLTVCETSGTTTLSSATPGGTWSSGAPGIATATTMSANDGQVTGVSDGTVIITYTSPLMCLATAEVTVNPAPDPITGVIPICAGQSMTLSNAISGGVWSVSPAALATITPTGGYFTSISGGVVTVAYTNECGVASIPVTINPLPAAIEGNDTVCVGSTTALADETIGGTWSSSFPAIASVLTTSGLISGHVPGSTTITYTMPGGCYTTLPVQVVLPPDVITGSMNACPGTTTTLSNAIAGGIWRSGSPSIATVNPMSGVVTGISAGLADITYTTGPGCAVYAHVLINPLPEPIIGADTIYCAADKDTLYNATPGGVWSSLTPGIATVDAGDGIMTILNGGLAIIRYTLPTGCYVSKSVSVNAAPMATVTYNPATNTLYTETTWGSYQWYNGIQGAIPGATTYRTAALYYTDYWVRVNDDNSCFGSSAHYNYNSASGATDPAMNRDNYFVFPNPSNKSITIDAPIDVRAVITSADGKALITQNHAKTIDISNLADGMYMVLLYDQNGIQRAVHKLIKQ